MRTSLKLLPVTIGLLITLQLYGQSNEYAKQKEEKLAKPSPFEAIVNGSEEKEILYQDKYVVAFKPLKDQAPVHFLIVPKKRIKTLNDVTKKDVKRLGHLFLAAAKLAKQFGVDESGYRVAMNTNEDAGQSVFHIHLHLLGGRKLGPMTNPIIPEDKEK
jgi:histidine triad (HIT) family protein